MRLLPAIYGVRDAENGGQLEALLSVLGEQAQLVQDNIVDLYNDQFVETCAQWALPYIGDLIGYKPIRSVDGTVSGSRAEVANTIGYRRRKGTAIALEQVCADVSGRPVKLVEEFRTTLVMQSMRCVTPLQPGFALIRDASIASSVGGPFGTAARRADVRRIAPRTRAVASPDTAPVDIAMHGGGNVNIPDIALFAYRCRSFVVDHSPACRVAAGRYTFDAAGLDRPLFNTVNERVPFDHQTARMDTPQPITLAEVLENPACFYGEDKSIAIWMDGLLVPVESIAWKRLSGEGAVWCCGVAGKVTVDVECGRIALSTEWGTPTQVLVRWAFGFAAEIGGGTYDRTLHLASSGLNPAFTAIVGSDATPTLESAVAAWNVQADGTSGRIVFPGYSRYELQEGSDLHVCMPGGSSLLMVSAVVHEQLNAPAVFTYAEAQATIACNIIVDGVAAAQDDVNSAQVILSGIQLLGQVTVQGEAVMLSVEDCTLLPEAYLIHTAGAMRMRDPSILVTSAGTMLSVQRSMTGPLHVSNAATSILCEVIVDSGSPCCIAYCGVSAGDAGGDLQIENSTVVGKVHARSMPLSSNTIFYARLARRDPWPAAVWCSLTQTGCVRFCWLPFASITPSRFKCLPTSIALEAVVRPYFASLRYGDPAYALLSMWSPMAIWQGADDGGQMGVMHSIQEMEGVRNMQLRIPEYLPVDLEAGVFLVTPHSTCKCLQTKPVYGIQTTHRDCCEGDGDLQAVTGIGVTLI